MTSNRSVSEMVERDESTALGRLAIFARETNDYTIRAEQMRPDVRELLAALSSQAQSDDVVERVARALHQHEDSWSDVEWEYLPAGTRELFCGQARAAIAAIPPAGGVEERLRLLVEESLYHLRLDARAEDYHKRALATLNESSAIGGGDGR